MQNTQDPKIIRESVKEYYGGIAFTANPSSSSGCNCSTNNNSCCQSDAALTITIGANNYESKDSKQLHPEVTGLSLGCGDPVTLASLKPGQTVLDLGSGGGMDCFLAAARVGITGKVIGIDMTTEMITKARLNKSRLDIVNVEFCQGEIEHLPLVNNSIDVIISNCVINLSSNKPTVFHEAFRVLSPGGLLAVSDIVITGILPENIKRDIDAWSSCLAGALEVSELHMLLKTEGFVEIAITRIGANINPEGSLIDHKGFETIPFPEISSSYQIFSAKITALKPYTA
ncbi:MAG: arsenite methyltransferase [Brevefilum sp.]|nr:arsenite methyltransferase [Brevefilum sp.]